MDFDMAWWTEKFEGKKIESGDDALGLVHYALEEICRLYMDEVGRKPTTAELRYALGKMLDTAGPDLFEDLEAKIVTGVAFKTKKTPKIQKYAVGDYFAIRLKTGEHCYGRILHKGPAGHLVEIYDFRTRSPVTLEQLLSAERKIVLNKHVHSLAAFRAGRWKILGHRDLEPDIELPKFRLGSRYTVYEIAQGDKCVKARREDVVDLEPMSMFDPETIEQRLETRQYENWPEDKESWNREFGEL